MPLQTVLHTLSQALWDMNVTGNGVRKELKLNLQHNTTLFKTYKIILTGKLIICFCLANKVLFSIKP